MTPVNNGTLPFEIQIPSQSSCDSLSTVNIDFEHGWTCRLHPFLTWHILIYSFTNSFIDWVYVGDVRFLGLDVPSQGYT